MARKNQKRTLKRSAENHRNVTANRKYKDTVFRILFSEKENLLSLYNAISGKDYEDPGALEIVTLENAIYMGIKNDLAFILDTNLYLYEHQSTFNPNMPLRDLLYITAEYQKLVDGKSLYSSILQKIPAPSFIVFYNSREEKEDRWVNYLSDAYENKPDDPNLELKVVTLNINKGHNKELMEQCKILGEYAQYVTKVREYQRKMQLDEAVKKAVDECIREGILKEFLRKNRAEVVAVSIFEYDKEEEERKLRKAEYEHGIERGRQEEKKKIVYSLKKFGILEKQIADIMNVSMKTVQQWLEEADIKSDIR